MERLQRRRPRVASATDMTNGRIAIVGLAALVVGLLLIAAPSGAPDLSIAVERPTSAPPRLALFSFPSAPHQPEAASGVGLASPPSSAVPRPAQQRENPLGRELRTTRDVRGFVQRAMLRPEQGGGYYALLALVQCDGKVPRAEIVGHIVERESTVSSRVLEQMDAVEARCVGLARAEIDDLRTQIDALAQEGRDPVLALQRQIHKAQELPGPQRDAAALQCLYEQAFIGNTSLASTESAAYNLILASFVSGPNRQDVLTFNGRTYTEERDHDAISLGAYLAGCVPGDFCSMDIAMQEGCRWRGLCFDSREALLEGTLSPEQKAMMDKVEYFRDIFRSAMARGDVSIFQTVRTPSVRR